MDMPLFGQALCLDANLDLLRQAFSRHLVKLDLEAENEPARARPGGMVAPLILDDIRMAWIDYGQPVQVRCPLDDWYTLIVVPRGRAVVRQAFPERISHGQVHLLAPNNELEMYYGQGAGHLAIGLKRTPERRTLLEPLFQEGATPARGLLEVLRRLVMDFIEDHRHVTRWEDSVSLVRRLGETLLSVIEQWQRDGQVQLPARPTADERILQIARFIRQQAQWDYEPAYLQDMAGMSLRGLYYAFERTLGSTPYRYYRTCKLLRVRGAIIRDWRQQHPIAWHATNEGFFHLSRFAAQYREMFGELPSDTVQRQRALFRSLQASESLEVLAVTAED